MEAETTSNTDPKPSRPPMREWTLRVVEALDVRPNMRRVVMTADDLSDFQYKPGQALMLMIPLGNQQFGRRDYTIRSFNPALGHIAIDFLMHGETPGPIWARTVAIGETISAKGPRGMTSFRADAEWHLLTGDETCIPAIAHLLETMPEHASTTVYIETADTLGEIDLARHVRWLHRGRLPAGPNDLMAGAIGAFEMPPGRGHAYLIGETSNVRKQRRLLLERGMTRDQISSEGYWRPGRIGGHDHVDD